MKDMILSFLNFDGYQFLRANVTLEELDEIVDMSTKPGDSRKYSGCYFEDYNEETVLPLPFEEMIRLKPEQFNKTLHAPSAEYSPSTDVSSTS